MALLDDLPSSSSCLSVGDVDPLLKDLNEKKQSIRRKVVSLTEELKEVRSRLASEERSYTQESVIRQVAETKDKNMEEELQRLHKRLKERNEQLQASSSTADKVAKAEASSESEVKIFYKDKVSTLLIKKDEEIAKLKDEIKIMSAHWKHKTKDLESQLEKQRKADQELKNKMLTLDFCL